MDTNIHHPPPKRKIYRARVSNSPLFRDFNPLYDEDALPPLGLGYIATAVRDAGVDVELVDAVADRIPLATLLDYTRQQRPQVVAVNVFTTNYQLVKEFVEGLSGTVRHVIVGGLSTRTLFSMISSWNYEGQLDVVFGDGEHITPDLVAGRVSVPPAATSQGARFFKVDSASRYYAHDISAVRLDRTFFKNEPLQHRRGFIEAHLVASRGCIYNCAFCAAARSLNRDLTIRERSVDSLREEVAAILDGDSRVESIRVLDDLFLKGPKNINAAIATFSSFPVDWRAMAHVNTFTGVGAEELRRLRDSGCKELFVGVESGSPRILKMIHKTSDTAKITDNLTRVLDAGIGLKTYFIYGFPGETREDFESTYALAAHLQSAARVAGSAFRTSVFQFRPYHGTELYHAVFGAGGEDDGVAQMEGDAELSALVGRLQFNFHSGNYSSESIDLVRAFIHRTADLSAATDWGI